MFKLPLISVAFLAAFALSGCASFDSHVNDLANVLDQPNVQKATATIATIAKAIPCDVSAGSSVAQSIEAQINAHQSATKSIYVISTALCGQLQGTVLPGSAKNVSAVTAVTAQ